MDLELITYIVEHNIHFLHITVGTTDKQINIYYMCVLFVIDNIIINILTNWFSV